MDLLRIKVQDILDEADIRIDGSRPWDIQIYDDRLYERVLLDGSSLALGESYMDDWWDAERLDEFFYRIFRAELHKKIRFEPKNLGLLLHKLKAKFSNQQSKSKAFEVGERHYDIGNDLFEAMLDDRMIYTCGYWKNAQNLDEAQENKLELICKKMGLKEGDRVLDIGCGWGGFLRYASEKYGISGMGLTISKKQAELARKSLVDLPIEIRLQDYRDTKDELFDHVVSIGMFEHVGEKNYKEFMQVAHRNLKEDGLFLLHTIGGNKSINKIDPWIDKYIFPDGMLPSIQQIGKSIEGLFVMEDLHNFGVDYDKTLMAWYKNFNNNWDNLKGEKYDDRFKRMWDYYLLSCAGLFWARENQLWQIVFSKKGVEGGYESVR